ncbi:MAG: TOMM precursor leader peptide-binding protein [Micromonosporaceae bacterium]|nr:TOMM precursor leader peptide-binding protein [Micromonosporaceae bacterium]
MGPLSMPGSPGCYLCASTREQWARNAVAGGAAKVWEAIADGTVTPEPALTAAVLAIVGGLVADDLLALGTGREPRSRDAVLTVSPQGTVKRHRFLPVPDCGVCGGLPDDSPSAGQLPLVPRPKPSREVYRLRTLNQRHDELLDRFVDERCGVISDMNLSSDGLVVSTAARLAAPRNIRTEGYGRAGDHRTSVCVAVAEALERLGGVLPRSRKTVVRGSFAEFGPERAVDPVSLGLSPALPDGHGNHFVEYRPDLMQDWVYGYSFRRGGPVLVPETIAYYGLPANIVYECSNGCALGGSLEEAILYGIFEVAERDGFLMTWYARLPLPRVDPWTSADPGNLALLSSLEHSTGSRVHLFDATMPEGVPVVVPLLVDEQDRPDHAKFCCTAGAHLDPERAMRSALVELASCAVELAGRTSQDRDRILEMVADSRRVTEMAHHAEVYTMPESWPRLEFLYRRSGTVSMAEAFPAGARYQPAADLSDDLHHVVRRYLAAGLDVIAVDQTTVEHRAAGLACVKVLIPGMLPMTFGHTRRRAEGMPRLHEVPVRLGYRNAPLADEEINPYPHPFP